MNLEHLSDENLCDVIDVSGAVECLKQNHPYASKVLVPFNPKRDLTVKCSNCELVYQRPPTPEEIQTYERTIRPE